MSTIQPHGGVLVNRLVEGAAREQLLKHAATLPQLQVNTWTISDIDCIAVGAFSPLTGFMNEADYKSVVDKMHLANGLAWSIPVTLSVDKPFADNLMIGDQVALVGADEVTYAILDVESIYTVDQQHEAVNVFKTDDHAHPGVTKLFTRSNIYVGGDIQVLNRPQPAEFGEFYFDPADTRKIFADKGWKTVVGFQTRNPVHRAHEWKSSMACS
jgi:sulfate adenylyltransferase